MKGWRRRKTGRKKGQRGDKEFYTFRKNDKEIIRKVR